MEQVLVIEAHEASYEDPIEFAPGDEIRITGREDIWDGHRWLWAVAPDGREGWIPDIFGTGDVFVAKEIYSARELTAAVGQRLFATRRLHGWAWCEREDGSGWIPERNLRIASDRT